MKKVFFYSISFLMIVSFTKLKAQTAKEELVSKNNPSLEKDAMKARARKNQINKDKKAKIAATSTIMVNPLDENDTYMGRTSEFLGNLTVSELPSDFPKYDKSYGLKYYNNLVDNFYGSHKDILKDGVRKKIEHHFPPAANQELNTK